MNLEGRNFHALIDPLHPGQSIRENCLEPLDFDVAEVAQALGVDCYTSLLPVRKRASTGCG